MSLEILVRESIEAIEEAHKPGASHHKKFVGRFSQLCLEQTFSREVAAKMVKSAGGPLPPTPHPGRSSKSPS